MEGFPAPEPKRSRCGSPAQQKPPQQELLGPEAPPRVLVIAGPTGVGKSALAERLCRQLDGEIISADSVQVRSSLGACPARASVWPLSHGRWSERLWPACFPPTVSLR
jgi:hypothetical protein